MKKITEIIDWYNKPESRKWKRVLNALEMSVILLMAIVVFSVVQIYGNGAKFQLIYNLFILAIAFSTASLIPSVYASVVLKRWQVQMITLGLGCGVGLSAIAGFLMLERHLTAV